MWGFVSSAENAQLTVDQQKSSVLAVSLAKVVAPEAAWICAYENDEGARGKMVGQVRVEGGTTDDVEIRLDQETSDNVVLLMHSDRGNRGVFEFDEANKEGSPDRPVFVNGKVLAETVALRGYGVGVASRAARIEVYPQGSTDATVTVRNVLAPADAWVVVQQSSGGRPGRVVGFAPVSAGALSDYPVVLKSGPPRGNLFVTLFADAGVAGRFEFDPESPLSSADQPYYVDGKPLTAEVRVAAR